MKIAALHEHFGAEVLDFEAMGPTSAEEIEELQRALDEHQLLLFRCGCELPPDRQMEIASWFGPIQETDHGAPWNVLDNTELAGSYPIPFHMDFTFTDAPIQRICLHALEVPTSGGATSYVSNVHAWDSLPPEMQAKVTGLTGRFRHVSPVVGEWPELVGDHPVRFVHPQTGQTALLVSEYHSKRILELDRPDSDRLLEELFAHLYRPEAIYQHSWRLHDMVIWDNRSIQHARRGGSKTSEGRRRLRRVALHDVSLETLVERVRQRWANENLEDA